MEDEKDLKNEENKMEVVEKNTEILDFKNTNNKSKTKLRMYTNINDDKLLFNVENNVDFLLNDCVDEEIRVKYALIKIYEKPLKEPIMNEETGEIEKDFEISMSTVIVDDRGKSYATGSKVFTMQLLRLLERRTNLGILLEEEPITIKIIKRNMKGSANKALSFMYI